MSLISKIGTLTNLSPEALNFLEEHVETQVFKRNEEVLRNGRFCNHLYFVTQGMLRGYYIIDNKEVSNWLATEGDFCTSYYSFIARTTSYETIEAIEKSEVQAISYANLNKVYNLFPETERAGRLILEEYYSRLEERMISLQFKSAKERYEGLQKNRPELLKRAPLGCIASYLGMTQETLSRIRAEL